MKRKLFLLVFSLVMFSCISYCQELRIGREYRGSDSMGHYWIIYIQPRESELYADCSCQSCSKIAGQFYDDSHFITNKIYMLNPNNKWAVQYNYTHYAVSMYGTVVYFAAY